MDMKGRITSNLRSTFSDKDGLNRQALKLRKSMKAVEKALNGEPKKKE